MRKVKSDNIMQNYTTKSSEVHDADPDTTAFQAGWPAWMGIMGSVWVIMAPFALVYFNYIPALASQLLTGTVAFILSAYCAYMANRDHDTTSRVIAGWLLVVCGVWLILAPFVLNYSSVPRAFSSSLITGIVFIVISLYGLLYHSKRFDKAIS